MNIGILTASLPSGATGGAEVQATRLALLLSRNHNVTVFTRSEPTLDSHADVDGVPFEICQRSSTNARYLRSIADVVGTMRELGRRRSRLDVLVAYQTVIDGVLGVLAKKLFRIPVLVSIRSEKEYRLERSVSVRILAPFVFRHADRIAVQTPTIRRELTEALASAGRSRLSGAIQSRLTVVPNGITLRDHATPRGDSVLYVGRLIAAKGVDHLVEAMRECPELELVIVGDGPEMDRLRRLAVSLPNVRFEGRATRDRLDDFFIGARMLVVPSVRDEGMPNVIMEAMSRGVPVIATRNAGIPDLIQDGTTGLLVDVGDPHAIASAMRRMAAEDGLAERCAANARRQIERYDWPKVLPLVERELRDLVGARRDRRGESS